MVRHTVLLGCLFLIACGSEETNGNDENNEVSDDISSIVETTNPEPIDLNGSSEENMSSDDVGDSEELTQITYMEEQHNFGTVFYPSDNLHTFKFKNTGNVPLIIQRATASCGCTVPNKPEEPVLPGEIGELDVIFRPKKGQVGGQVEKKITVVANTEPKETYLHITANVVEGM